jgi:uncharacterized membrane protein
MTSNRESVKRPVLIEYPRRDIWCLGYATGEIVMKPNGEPLVTVFLPTTPNPTSGFLLLVPMKDVWDLNMSVENAVRMIISGGILSPDNFHVAPFRGLHVAPDLPTPAPLTTGLPAELVEGRTPPPDSSLPLD